MYVCCFASKKTRRERKEKKECILASVDLSTTKTSKHRCHATTTVIICKYKKIGLSAAELHLMFIKTILSFVVIVVSMSQWNMLDIRFYFLSSEDNIGIEYEYLCVRILPSRSRLLCATACLCVMTHKNNNNNIITTSVSRAIASTQAAL